MTENILLSYAVDSAIHLEEELGEYDHLVMVNPRWMERFAEPDKGCLVTLSSTGNLLFTDEEKLLELLEKSELNNYVQTYIWDRSTE